MPLPDSTFRPGLVAALVTLTAVGLFAAAPAAAAPPVVRVPDMPLRTPLTDSLKDYMKRAYAQAQGAYESGDTAGALAIMDQLYTLYPSAAVQLVRVQLLEDLGRRADAYDALLLASDFEPSAAELAEIRAGLRRLGPRLEPPLGRARVSPTPAGAIVRISNVPVPAGRAVALSAGTHTLDVEATDHEPHRATLLVTAGEDASVDITLTPRATLPPVEARHGATPPADPTQGTSRHGATAQSDASQGTSRHGATPRGDLATSTTPRMSNAHITGWSLLGAGVAALGGGAAFHVLALQAKDERDGYTTPRADLPAAESLARYESADSDMATRSTVSVLLYGLGGAAAVTGAALLLATDATEPATAAPAWRPGFTALPALHGGLFTLQGGF